MSIEACVCVLTSHFCISIRPWWWWMMDFGNVCLPQYGSLHYERHDARNLVPPDSMLSINLIDSIPPKRRCKPCMHDELS